MRPGLVVLVERFRTPSTAVKPHSSIAELRYWIAWLVLVVGSIVLMRFFMKNLGQMVDLATTLSLSPPIWRSSITEPYHSKVPKTIVRHPVDCTASVAFCFLAGFAILPFGLPRRLGPINQII